MENVKLMDWFCSLSIQQKEHIACKVLLQQGKDPKEGVYPRCVTVWESLTFEQQQSIYEHCTDHHGMFIQQPGDAPFYSF